MPCLISLVSSKPNTCFEGIHVGLGVERLLHEGCLYMNVVHHGVTDALVFVTNCQRKTTWSDRFITMIVALISATINDDPTSSY